MPMSIFLSERQWHESSAKMVHKRDIGTAGYVDSRTLVSNQHREDPVGSVKRERTVHDLPDDVLGDAKCVDA